MALLSAEDVLNKAFSKTKYREGFDQDEVDDFLDEVAHTVTSLVAERDDLAQRLAQAQAGAPVAPSAPAAETPVESTEGGLLAAATDPTPPSATGMLAMAQKLHDEYVQAGEEIRERLIDEGKVKAESIVEQAETDAKHRMDTLVEERTELEGKIDDLRRFERDYRTRLKSYLENLLGDLDHGAKAEPAQPAPDLGSGFGAQANDDASGHGAVPSFGAPAASDGDSDHASSAPSAPESPWAHARPQDSSATVTADSQDPAPWGASTYRPKNMAPQGDAPSAHEAGTEPEADDKDH